MADHPQHALAMQSGKAVHPGDIWDETVWEKIGASEARDHLLDDEFKGKISEILDNPKEALRKHMNDPRIMQVPSLTDNRTTGDFAACRCSACSPAST